MIASKYRLYLVPKTIANRYGVLQFVGETNEKPIRRTPNRVIAASVDRRVPVAFS